MALLRVSVMLFMVSALAAAQPNPPLRLEKTIDLPDVHGRIGKRRAGLS